MKLLTEYLDRAINLERLASDEPDSSFKAQLLTQAAAYRWRLDVPKNTACRLQVRPKFQTKLPSFKPRFAGAPSTSCG
jgi:hypothetical protein